MILNTEFDEVIANVDVFRTGMKPTFGGSEHDS